MVMEPSSISSGKKIILWLTLRKYLYRLSKIITIKGIHRKRVSVPAATAGQSVTLALKNIRRNAIRKGQVLLTHEKDEPMPKVSRRFEAEILVLYHSTTIKSKYQAMVHCGAVRQTASITTTEQTVLRTGDRAKVVSFLEKFDTQDQSVN
ncbi:hypothetical protein CU098_003522 [Rhizopus stolonifer]|uniref:Uncharacterized protein n=1 Tax=Rhizopus stolonifer TaxID=4846 RepID=A0A367IUP2_RHIST|nr:hypothetical protein CU098_003522 [Rhizopus stolonifer]